MVRVKETNLLIDELIPVERSGVKDVGVTSDLIEVDRLVGVNHGHVLVPQHLII